MYFFFLMIEFIKEIWRFSRYVHWNKISGMVTKGLACLKRNLFTTLLGVILKLRCIAFYQMGLQATVPLKRLAMANIQEKRTECIGTNQWSQYLFHLIKPNKTHFQNILWEFNLLLHWHTEVQLISECLWDILMM